MNAARMLLSLRSGPASQHALGGRGKAVAGGLMAYGPSYAEIFHQTAFYADKLLKGVKPQELPFEQASKFELVINMKTARALGLEFPQSILLRADEMFE